MFDVNVIVITVMFCFRFFSKKKKDLFFFIILGYYTRSGFCARTNLHFELDDSLGVDRKTK